MKKISQFKLKLLVAAIGLTSLGAQAAAITAGDLVIYRVGTAGNTGLTSAATSVFLDEYNTSGGLVQSILMPTSTSGANKMLTASATASSEGELTISSNGKYIALTGYNAVLGTATVASTSSSSVNRTVGIFDVTTGLTDTRTALTDAPTGNNIRSAVTTNGTDIWLAGAVGGVRYTTEGSTTSTQLSTTVANIRQVDIFGGQLFASDASGTAVRLGTVGTGEPTTAGQTITNLSGLSASTGSPYSYFLTHLNGTGTTLDTLYLADDGVGITKYDLVSGSWVAKGTVGTAADTYRGLTGVVTGNTVNLFATGLGGSGTTGGGKLVAFSDISGFGGAFTATGTLLATASANEAFRGVVYVPATISAVPVPGAIWLFGSALLGMIGFKRRKA